MGLSNESVSDQLVEGSNNSVGQGQVQCLVDSDADSTHNSDYTTVIMAGEGNGDVTDKEVTDEVFEVEVNKEESPSIFNERKLPKTVSSNQFIGVITTTCTLRTKIMKGMKNVVATAKEITSIETEAGEIDEEFIEELYNDIQNEYVKMKERLKEHEDKTSQIRTMTGFIINTNKTSKQPLAIKSRDDAGKALEEAERHEEELTR